MCSLAGIIWAKGEVEVLASTLRCILGSSNQVFAAVSWWESRGLSFRDLVVEKVKRSRRVEEILFIEGWWIDFCPICCE